MTQKKPSSRRNRRSPYLFIALTAILLLALFFVGVRAMNAWEIYEKEAAVTPVPTPTVRPVIVTHAPDYFTFTPAPSPTPSYLSVGSSGEMVVKMQETLKALGYYSGAVDGQYGSGTKRAVEVFQKQHGLSADGIAGNQTLSMLYSEKAKQIVITPTPAPYDILNEEKPLLVNAKNPLPGDFVPADLVNVKAVAGDLFVEYADSNIQGVKEAVDALTKMIGDAVKEGYSPWKLREGYRTFKQQERIFNNQVEEYIEERQISRSQAISAAKLLVADPGESEHHTGLAFDLNVPGQFFSDTAQYLWLKENCWDYGFIMRYTDEKEEITGILGEEWHVRYVGIEHSKRMQELDYCLEEYIEYMNWE